MEEESISLFEEKPKMGALFNHKKTSQDNSFKHSCKQENGSNLFNNCSYKSNSDPTQEPYFDPPNPVESRVKGGIPRDFSWSR